MFPERVDVEGGVDSEGATCDREASLLSVADGFRASYKRLAMVALDPLVTRWREARCRRRTSAGKRASCSAEQLLMSAGGATDDERRRRLVLGMTKGKRNTGNQTRARLVELLLELWQTFS